MVAKKIVIRNKAGIHCRPSSAIMTEVEKFPQVEFSLAAENGTSSMHSILELLALGLQKGDEATLQATGPDEQAACDAVAAALETEYDFPSQQ